MPKIIDSQGDIVQFKILPHYFKAIKTGEKKADIRILTKRWQQLIQHASIIEFVNTETEEKIAFQIKNVGNFNGTKEEISYLFSDIDWFISSNDCPFPIIIYLGNIIDWESSDSFGRI